jgi:drug/metabolite transporter (DMT)-like permease
MNSNLTDAVTSPLLIVTPAPSERRSPGGLLRQWWVAFSASSLFVVSGHLLIKLGLSAGALTASGPAWTRVLHCALQPEVAGGLLVYFLGSLCWMVAVAQREISFLYPLSSINYVLVVFASSMFFHESPSLRRLSGVALIVLGMVLMNRKGRGTERGTEQ